jgi:hypothetical protein
MCYISVTAVRNVGLLCLRPSARHEDELKDRQDK